MSQKILTGRTQKREYRCAKCKGPVRSNGTGLGTWTCTNGCPKRYFTIVRRCDSGKEAERTGPGGTPCLASFAVNRPIAVEVILL